MTEFQMRRVVEKSGVQIAYGETGNISLRINQNPRACWTKYVEMEVDVTKISCSPSYYWASVANAPNVLQPYWFIVLPLDVSDLTASLLLRGPSGQRWRCL